VEFRTDRLRSLSILEHVPERKPFPAIITHKNARAAVGKIILQAAAAGFDFVDVDLDSDITKSELKEIRAKGAEVIVSYHNYAATPSRTRLLRILRLAEKKGADICKIVTTATSPRDNLTVLNFLDERQKENRIVCFAMGDLGIPSRILSPLFGAEFTFAALNEKSLTAPGQLTIDNLRKAWSLLGIQ
jgi:3-dehydroquinate dehydratase type I